MMSTENPGGRPGAWLCGPAYLRGIKIQCDGNPCKGIPCACTREMAAVDEKHLDRRVIDGVTVDGPPS
jgi:hypothetical protein